jgi:hypothetical protein
VTYSGTDVYKFDLSMTSQGQVGGQEEVLVATHAIRAYADKRPSASEDFQVNVNRDNEETPGHALICLSGCLVDLDTARGKSISSVESTSQRKE